LHVGLGLSVRVIRKQGILHLFVQALFVFLERIGPLPLHAICLWVPGPLAVGAFFGAIVHGCGAVGICRSVPGVGLGLAVAAVVAVGVVVHCRTS
jgi:hypothetical protein